MFRRGEKPWVDGGFGECFLTKDHRNNMEEEKNSKSILICVGQDSCSINRGFSSPQKQKKEAKLDRFGRNFDCMSLRKGEKDQNTKFGQQKNSDDESEKKEKRKKEKRLWIYI